MFFLFIEVSIFFKNLDTKKTEFPQQVRASRSRCLEFFYQNPKMLMRPFCNCCALGLPFPVVGTKPIALSCLEFEDVK